MKKMFLNKHSELNPMKKIVEKNTAIFSVNSFLIDLSSEMIFPLLPLFLVGVLGATEFEVGIIEGVAFGTIGLFSLCSLYFINKLGNEKRAAIFGYALSSIMKFGFVIAGSWIHVLIVRFLERAGKGVRIVARDTLIALSEKKQRLGLAFGVRQSADVLGMILGPLIAALLLYAMVDLPLEEAYRNVFLVATIIALFSVPTLFFLKQKGKPKKIPLREIINYIFSGKHKGILAIIGIIFFANFSVMFFILRAAEFLPYYIVPIAYIGYSALFALFSVPAGIVSDKIGTNRMLIFGLLVYIASLGIFAYYPSIMGIFLGFVSLGIFKAILEVSAKIMATKNADGERYDVIFSSYQTVSRFVKLPSNIIAGFLWLIPLFGVPSTLIFGILVSLIGIGALIKIDGKLD